MKGKVNWFHVLQIFLAGLVGAIIFVIMLLPTNFDNAISYESNENKMMKKRDAVLKCYDISEEELNKCCEDVKYDPIITSSEVYKEYTTSKIAYENSKQSLNAILIAFFIPLAVTLLFCGIKAYEDIKS